MKQERAFLHSMHFSQLGFIFVRTILGSFGASNMYFTTFVRERIRGSSRGTLNFSNTVESNVNIVIPMY